MRAAECTVDIDAPIALVWKVVGDFARYHEWNPFIVGVDRGEAVVGSTLGLRVKWAAGGGASPVVNVTRVDGPAPGPGGEPVATLEYRFVGLPASLGMVRSTRVQTLTAQGPEATRYHSREVFRGWLAVGVPLAKVQRGFDLHAEALKRRAESLVGA